MFSDALKAQQTIPASNDTFDKIFGTPNFQKYNADTLIAPSKGKVIYSGAQCKLIGYNEKGQEIWSRTLIEKQCGLLAFMLIDPKDNKKIKKGCEALIQYKDKTIYCVNIKTGAFYLVNL